MNKLKRFTLLFFMLGVVFATGYANAANETATSSMEITANSGSTLYKEALRPVSLKFDVTIKSPYPANAKAIPMKQITIKFPTDLKFIPGNTPACTKISNNTNTAIGSLAMVKLCPNSLVGNGGAGIYLAKINGASPNLTDPVLLAFYGGKTKDGLPILKVTGFSKGTGAGIYMTGALQKDGTLTFQVPVLSYDSAVGNFNLSFPGKDNAVPEYRSKITNFVQAKCSTGEWKLNTSFVLGERDAATATPYGPETFLSAPLFTQACSGAAGTAKSVVSLSGPATAKAGQTKTYKIVVRNPGTATLSNVQVKTSGKWLKGKSYTLGNIAPGTSKSVAAKVTVLRSAKTKRTTVLNARVSSNSVSVKTATKKISIK